MTDELKDGGAKAGKAAERAAKKDAVAAAADQLAGADVAVGGIEASDIFSLGGDFEPQNSSAPEESTRAALPGKNGDEVASTTHDTITRVSCTYKYKAANGNITMTALKGGALLGGYIVDSIKIDYAANDWPTVTVTGHQHASNAHAACATYTASLTFPAGFGCADLLTNAGAASSVTSASYTLTVNHKDVTGKTGDHLAGDSNGATESLTMQFYGAPTLTTTGWDVTQNGPGDSNADFDTWSFAATKGLARDAA